MKLSCLLDELHTFLIVENFHVIDCPNMTSFPSMPGGFESLFQRLEIKWGNIKILLTGLQSCTTIEYIKCLNLILHLNLRELSSLIYLKIKICEKLSFCPRGF